MPGIELDIDWKNLPDDVLHGFNRPGANPWTMSHRINRLRHMQEKTPLVVNKMPLNENLLWAHNRILVLSFPDWIIEQVPLDQTPPQHLEMVKQDHQYLEGEGWIHLRSKNKKTKKELAISLLIGGYHQEKGTVTLVRREGQGGMLNRIISVSNGQTIFVLADTESFTVKKSTLNELKASKLKLPGWWVTPKPIASLVVKT